MRAARLLEPFPGFPRAAPGTSTRNTSYVFFSSSSARSKIPVSDCLILCTFTNRLVSGFSGQDHDFNYLLILAADGGLRQRHLLCPGQCLQLAAPVGPELDGHLGITAEVAKGQGHHSVQVLQRATATSQVFWGERRNWLSLTWVGNAFHSLPM